MRRVNQMEWLKRVGETREAATVTTPQLDGELVDVLFGKSEPADVKLLVPAAVLDSKDKEFRDQLRRLTDINFNVKIRLADGPVPACVASAAGDEVLLRQDSSLPDQIQDDEGLRAYLQASWSEADEWPRRPKEHVRHMGEAEADSIGS